jgi:hypothetical protein
MGRQIVEADRSSVADEQAEDAVPLGQITDAAPVLLGHPGVDEPGETGAPLVEHAQRGVAGADQSGGGLDDSFGARRPGRARTRRAATPR